MKEHPILFSGEMVRAILEGRKTQTRRIVKPNKNTAWLLDGSWSDDYVKNPDNFLLESCPYGQPGDKLWVRETFVLEQDDLEGDEPVIPTDRPHFHHPGGENEFDNEYYLFPHYRATDPTPELMYEDRDEPTCKWRPSIFMPRWASRITLEIVNVRVERVQDISEQDAKAEGVEFLFSQEECDTTAGIIGTKPEDHGYENYLWHGNFKGQQPPVEWFHQGSNYKTAKESFSSLWHLINAKRGYGWDVNPWVWVVEFKVL